jgi:hypothetical protein
MWWTDNQIILAVEIMKYMWWNYCEYLSTPYDIIQAILIRMEQEAKVK